MEFAVNAIQNIRQTYSSCPVQAKNIMYAENRLFRSAHQIEQVEHLQKSSKNSK